MATDMKTTIADAACRLLIEKHVKKPTVKDIVEECNITRQAFYYHFEGIPELLQWIISSYSETTIRKAMDEGGDKEGLRCFFVMAIHIIPFVELGLGSNYRQEVDHLMRHYIQHFFVMIAERKNLYANRTKFEADLILRYHSRAIYGLLREWSDQDTEHLDQIVDTVYLMITEGIPAR